MKYLSHVKKNGTATHSSACFLFFIFFFFSYYLIIIVPLGKSNQLPKDQVPDDFFKEVRRRKRDPDNVKEEPYIAAKFRSDEMPKTFNVGDKKFKNRYGYNNKELTKGFYYTMFTRAYVKNNKGVSEKFVFVDMNRRGHNFNVLMERI